MKQTPLLYTAPMVRAQLNGTKTQTRRLVKGEALRWLQSGFEPSFVALPENGLSPYGYVGDMLWGREAWRAYRQFDLVKPSDLQVGSRVKFEADGMMHLGRFSEADTVGTISPAWGKLRPSMFMPRWACRLEHTLTSVSIERLQDISEADALAEGVEEWAKEIPHRFPTARELYESLWVAINGPGSWNANPYVWRLSWAKP